MAGKPIRELDGSAICDFKSFCDEVSRKLLPTHSWGGNLDAFNDILRGGFGTPEGGFILRWTDSDSSRRALGHAETARYFEHIATQCHPENVAGVLEDIAKARRGEGPTLFDIIAEIIRDHGPGGDEEEDGVELELK